MQDLSKTAAQRGQIKKYISPFGRISLSFEQINESFEQLKDSFG